MSDPSYRPTAEYPSRETTEYRLTVPTEDWERWKATVPDDDALYERLHMLIVLDTRLAAMPDETERIDWQLLRLKLHRIYHRAETAREYLPERPADAAAELSAIRDLCARMANPDR